MKATLNLSPAPVEYPFIGIDMAGSGLVILFSGCGTGTILAADPNAGYAVGHFTEGWDTDTFEPLAGSITMSND